MVYKCAEHDFRCKIIDDDIPVFLSIQQPRRDPEGCWVQDTIHSQQLHH